MTHDDLYEALVAMHRGLDAEQSLLVNSRLILLLSRHVSDESVWRRCIAEARAGVAETTSVA
ncbi:DUF2783 domain-containing protein [Azospirillum sp. RWY-5-1]|uniref:DUF2783 domain-containing protein n=1 Tax=Azospirillum oleiclasticum TaxID=2735135 RepID=A0ABX2T3A6_9PROT|nr:DUF2783 domain-containing protein [Azospirillum oleiclasticum]NYZ11572.1 DUF2783 domain-containing protein [Azospirillum oleiclasticum]NYZ18733.1 DUF2783 domain-containing protein [Azospirillum oleiclasticum]